MSNTITPLKAWMRAATVAERESLARSAGTTVGMLNQYAGGHRYCSAERAGAFEKATREMHKASRGRLPIVYRTDLCEACRSCQYAAKCLGERAVVSDFPIVNTLGDDQ